MRISDWSSDVCSSDLVVRGTITDSDGHFILSPLEQSSAVGNYDVVIAGATTATNIVSDVPVSAHTTTTLSTADVTFVLTPLLGGLGTINGRTTDAAAVALEAMQHTTILPQERN